MRKFDTPYSFDVLTIKAYFDFDNETISLYEEVYLEDDICKIFGLKR